MKVIVGLGNPGRDYAKTRHNIGFMVLDELHRAIGELGVVVRWSTSKKTNCEISETIVNGEKIVLAKPLTYMNESGQAMQLLKQYYNLTLEHILIIHDDKDLPLGTVKLQRDRGHAGHNGVRSIFEHLSTTDLTRIRVGIASTNTKRMQDIPNFVLGKFSLLEKKTLRNTIHEAASIAWHWIDHVE